MGMLLDWRPCVPVPARLLVKVNEAADDVTTPTDTQPSEAAERSDASQNLSVPDTRGDEQRDISPEHHWSPKADSPTTQDHWDCTERATLVESDWIPPEGDMFSPVTLRHGTDLFQQSQLPRSQEEQTWSPGKLSHQHHEPCLNGPIRAVEWFHSALMPFTDTTPEPPELSDSFVHFPRIVEESAGVQREQILRKPLDLNILSLEVNENREDGLCSFRRNVSRESEEHGFDVGGRQEFPSIYDGFSDSAGLIESPETLSDPRRGRDGNEQNEDQASAYVVYYSELKVDVSANLTSLSLSTVPNLWQQSDSRKSAPGVTPLPNDLGLSHSDANPICDEPPAGVHLTKDRIPPTDDVPVLLCQTGEEPQRPPDIQGHHVIHISETSPLPVFSPTDPSHPDASPPTAAVGLTGPGAGRGWRSFTLRQHRSLDGRVPLHDEAGIPPNEPASDNDDRADSSDENDALLRSSEPINRGIWGFFNRPPRRSCCGLPCLHLSVFLLSAWVSLFCCLLVGDEMGAYVLLAVYMLCVVIFICKKAVVPTIREMWSDAPETSGELREVTVVQSPQVRMRDLVEAYP